MSVGKKKVVIVAMALMIAAVLVVVLWPGEREPEYQGRKLSEWLEVYATYSEGDPRHDEAAEAVRHMGTNCVPYLLRWIRGHPWKMDVLVKGPGRWPPGVVGALMGKDTERSISATVGFEILGPEANSAIPALATLATNSTYPLTSYNAMNALMHIGGDGLERVLAVVTNGSAPANLRLTAIHVLVFEAGQLAGSPPLGPEDPIVVALRRVSQDSDANIRDAATNVLLKIAPEAETNGVDGGWLRVERQEN